MFDKRTVFQVLSPDAKSKGEVVNNDELMYGDNPCTLREVQAVFKAPYWIKDGTKIRLEGVEYKQHFVTILHFF